MTEAPRLREQDEQGPPSRNDDPRVQRRRRSTPSARAQAVGGTAPGRDPRTRTRTSLSSDVDPYETDFLYHDEKYGSGAAGGRVILVRHGRRGVRDNITRMDLRTGPLPPRRGPDDVRQRRQEGPQAVATSRPSAAPDRPEWMNLSIQPVIPPSSGRWSSTTAGRNATSDLKRPLPRVINATTGLKRLQIGAPRSTSATRSGAPGFLRALSTTAGRPGIAGTAITASSPLSAMLKGKQGRFRPNLLGSASTNQAHLIVVGPDLKPPPVRPAKKWPSSCTSPSSCAARGEGLAHNIKRRSACGARVPVVWYVLEEVIKDHPVCDMRPDPPTPGIQAILRSSSRARRSRYRSTAPPSTDFDGDQMAVHVPRSPLAAQEEARTMKESTANSCRPPTEPVEAPPQDMDLVASTDDGRASIERGGPGRISPTRGGEPCLPAPTVTLPAPVEAISGAGTRRRGATYEQPPSSDRRAEHLQPELPDRLASATRLSGGPPRPRHRCYAPRAIETAPLGDGSSVRLGVRTRGG